MRYVLFFCWLLLSLLACKQAAKHPPAQSSAPEALQVSENEVKPETESRPTSIGFYHNVYFWLKPELTAAEHKEFELGLDSLSLIPVITEAYYGGTSTSTRDVVDDSYDYALIVAFPDSAAQEAYQIHPMHLYFVDRFGPWFEKVQVYDSYAKKATQ